MRTITKIRRSIRAVSPVISVLLMIAIAVIASLVAYAWVMGYLGGQTDTVAKGIQLQSYTSKGNLVIYVQNTGQGTVHLGHDVSVYVNDVLRNILLVDDVDASAGQLDPIPIADGQTLKLVIDYIPQPNEQLRIKIVTLEGTFIEGSGKAGPQTSQVEVTFTKDPISAVSTISPTGTQSYYVGSVIQIKADVASGETLANWEASTPSIQINDDQATTSLATINAAGTITANFVSSSEPRLEFITGASQPLEVNEMSQPITIKRLQDPSGSITVNLDTTSATGAFYASSSGGSPITTIDIASQGGTATFYYKDSVAGYPTLTISATGYASDTTKFTINAPQPTPTPTTSPTVPPENNAPTARFTFTPTDLTVAFDASTSSDSDGTIVSYAWNFGDSSLGSDMTTSHTYSAAGLYSVDLTVTDDDGATHSVTHDVPVSGSPPANIPPTATFTYTANGLTVQFTDTSQDPDGSVVAWSWNFGDSSPTSTVKNPSHTYSAAGTYTVSLTVMDDDGETSAPYTQNVQVSIPQYQVTFGSSGLGGDATGDLVSYSVSGGGPSGTFGVAGGSIMVDQGATVSYEFFNPVESSVDDGKRYLFDGQAAGEVSSAATVTRNYQTQYRLTVTSEHGTTEGQGWYNSDAIVNAGLDSGEVVDGNVRYVFTSWGTDASGTDFAESEDITMDGPKTATADWKTQYYVTFEVDPAGSGTTTDSGWFDQGEHSITASPAENYRFTSWTTEGSIIVEPSDEASATATVNGAGTITANFESTLIPLLNTGFEGDATTWAEGWNDWPNPPWYRGTDDAHSGSTSAKSDGLEWWEGWIRHSNDGPFTCDPLDASDASVIHVSFWYKIVNPLDGDLRLYYSGLPNTNPYNPTFTYTGIVLGDSADEQGEWLYCSFDIVDTSAFTETFRFRFISDLNYDEGWFGEPDIMDQVWVDDLVITMEY